jgi:hypothetical protein
MNAQQTFNLETKPAVVLADGPYEADGDGGCEFCVCFGDADGEPITENKACVWYLWDPGETDKFAAQLAEKYGLELINEATPV